MIDPHFHRMPRFAISIRDQCDQIGRFLRYFRAKEAQVIDNFLGYYEKLHS